MKVVTPKEMNEIDYISINAIGIPGIVLMENAALKVVEEVIKSLVTVSKKMILIFAGKGNNGGDAFAAARHLHNMGANVIVYVVPVAKEIIGDAGVNFSILSKMGIHTIQVPEKTNYSEIEEFICQADLVIDGILGTGFKGRLKGLIKRVVEAVNNSHKQVISIDIPTGINAETGEVEGLCVNASKTVTFALPKIGLLIHPGCEHVGELTVADIGIPSQAYDELDIKINTIESGYVSKLIPGRQNDTNKGDYGRVMIISGSIGMTGAGCLTAGAALRTGAGLVYLGVPSILTSVYDAAMMEAVTIPLEDNARGCLSKDCIGQILDRIKRSSVIAVGPGLSVSDDIVEVVTSIIEVSNIPIVMDADALNALAKDVSILKKLRTEAVITPHPGEMARLMGMSTSDVQNNRIGVASGFARQWGVITVLKGARTIVASPEGIVYINTTGNSGMATAGTGDVLTGVIACLIGQGVKPFEAAVAAVYLHGKAGDKAAEKKGMHGLIAGDLLDELPIVIKELIRK